jgi:hypothetical protein
LIAAAIAGAAAPACAQVRDALYRGTMVCDKLPFTAGKSREAIEVTIAGGSVRYSRVVRLRGIASSPREEGSGSLSGQNISLLESWKSIVSMKPNMPAPSCDATRISKGPKPGMTAARP